MKFFNRLALKSVIPFAVQATPVSAEPPTTNNDQDFGLCDFIAPPGLLASSIEQNLHSASLHLCAQQTANQALVAVDEISVKLLNEVDKIDDFNKWDESSHKIIEWYAHCDIGEAKNLVDVWKSTEQCMTEAKDLIKQFNFENAQKLNEFADDVSEAARSKAIRSFAKGPLIPT